MLTIVVSRIDMIAPTTTTTAMRSTLGSRPSAAEIRCERVMHLDKHRGVASGRNDPFSLKMAFGTGPSLFELRCAHRPGHAARPEATLEMAAQRRQDDRRAAHGLRAGDGGSSGLLGRRRPRLPALGGRAWPAAADRVPALHEPLVRAVLPALAPCLPLLLRARAARRGTRCGASVVGLDGAIAAQQRATGCVRRATAWRPDEPAVQREDQRRGDAAGKARGAEPAAHDTPVPGPAGHAAAHRPGG